MPTLLIEMPGGVAGDMLLAALIDLGGDRERLLSDLAALGLGAIAIDVAAVHVNGIAARRADVRVEQAGERWLYAGAPAVAIDLARAAPAERAPAPPHAHGAAAAHAHEHAHRPYRAIRDLIARAPLPARARERAQRAFRLLAEAEGAVHGVPVDDVEFHEVGSLDAIVDVVGACLLLEQLGVERVVCGPFTPGEGHARCAHGVVPVPVPAVARMLAEARAPQRRLDRDVGELTTPTGCAIVLALTDEPLGARVMGDAPLVATRIGYGAGHRKIEGLTNAVRLSLLDDRGAARDVVIELRCELDDATGEQLGALIDDLLAAGAKDAYLTPVLMKKGRPGHLLTALAAPDGAAALMDLVLARSTSIGVRASDAVRRVLPRRVERVVVAGHPIALKVVTLPDGSERAKPEADDVIACARATNRSFADVAAAALAARGR